MIKLLTRDNRKRTRGVSKDLRWSRETEGAEEKSIEIMILTPHKSMGQRTTDAREEIEDIKLIWVKEATMTSLASFRMIQNMPEHHVEIFQSWTKTVRRKEDTTTSPRGDRPTNPQ